MDYRIDVGTHITLGDGGTMVVTERTLLPDITCINCDTAGGVVDLVAEDEHSQQWIGIRCQRCGFSSLDMPVTHLDTEQEAIEFADEILRRALRPGKITPSA